MDTNTLSGFGALIWVGPQWAGLLPPFPGSVRAGEFGKRARHAGERNLEIGDDVGKSSVGVASRSTTSRSTGGNNFYTAPFGSDGALRGSDRFARPRR